MRIFQCRSQCQSCLEELVKNTVAMSTPDEVLREDFFRQAKEKIAGEFSPDTIPAMLATKLLREMKARTGCEDPFLPKKIEEMKHSRTIFDALADQASDADFERLLQLAALANSFDYFNSPGEVMNATMDSFSWAVYDGEEFLELVKRGKGPFLYLADNAGELFFDLPLFRKISSYIPESYYVVKGGPIQNDITMEDVRRSNLDDLPAGIISNGLDAVGLDVEGLPADFRERYDNAALILAKGMAHFESLSSPERSGRTLFVLKAKCEPVARSMGVNLNEYVAFLQ